jgi:hypothetical protein
MPTAIAVVAHVVFARSMGFALHYSSNDISTVCTFITGVLGLALVFRASRPFNAGRAFLFAGVAIAFISAFLFLPDVFEFSDMLSELGLAAVVLAVTGIAIAWLLRKLAVWVWKRWEMT